MQVLIKNSCTNNLFCTTCGVKKVNSEIPEFETVRRLENVLVKFNFLSHKSTPKKKLAF